MKVKILRDVNTKTSRFEWLSWPDSMAPAPSPRSRIVLLDFIGRRTAYQGRYGHMGLADSEVIVDRLISAREIYRSSTPYLEDELLERKR
ncbi:hypothetical protein [Sphingomonas sp. LM7]|uniref:hypothetical protein n=1 Tax=Sphingomonas sp. LM7 TaxID=1938607 RepID=UPI0012374854|nr:hypothetical protein [Sphingomonas sp. LM7]